MEKLKRSKQDFSHITPPEGSRIIPLTRGKYALVDEEDYERVMKHNWYCLVTKDGKEYAVHKSKEYLSMHRVIMGLEKTDKRVIDHIFGETLDNRKSQLRICTIQQNSQNSRSSKGMSKYKGVSWDKPRNKWKAQICPSFKTNTFIGRYDTEIEAARAYDTKAKELHGEFAYLNFKCISK